MLDSLITSKIRVQVLMRLFLNPGSQAYLRELANQFDASPGHVRSELKQLNQAGLLTSAKAGRQVRYWANCTHPLFPELREYGWDWPSMAHSMIGSKRMHNLRVLAERALFDRVPGDFIETGIWRGGACIRLRAVLKAYQVRNRRVWVADSFEGLPPPNPEKYPADTGDSFHTYSELAVPMEEVKRNFERYALLDDQVLFLRGWFKDSLPGAHTGPLAILRLDGDMYESTSDALEQLYDRVSIGGYLIVDDYHVVEGCKQAVDDFRASRQVDEKIEEIDGVGVFWQKLRPCRSGLES